MIATIVPNLVGLVGYVTSSTDKGRCNVALTRGEAVEHLALRPVNVEEVDVLVD